MTNKEIEIALQKLEQEIKKQIPGYHLYIKERSGLMKFLGSLLFFNKRFMTDFTTTVYPNVYMPRSQWENARVKFEILTHEFVHLLNAKKKGVFLWGFAYLLPQILAPLALLSLLAIPFSNWWLLNLSWLVLAGPLPAYFRMKEELEGYTMSMLVTMHLYDQDGIDFIGPQFYASGYYFMWPFKKSIIKRLKNERNDLMIGKYDDVYPYSFVKQLIK